MPVLLSLFLLVSFLSLLGLPPLVVLLFFFSSFTFFSNPPSSSLHLRHPKNTIKIVTTQINGKVGFFAPLSSLLSNQGPVDWSRAAPRISQGASGSSRPLSPSPPTLPLALYLTPPPLSLWTPVPQFSPVALSSACFSTLVFHRMLPCSTSCIASCFMLL